MQISFSSVIKLLQHGHLFNKILDCQLFIIYKLDTCTLVLYTNALTFLKLQIGTLFHMILHLCDRRLVAY